MELKGKFVTQFKVRQQPRLTTLLLSKRAKRQSLVVHSIFRETFPVSNSRWKTLEVHCDNNQSIWQPAVSKNDSSKPPELSFNRLQLSDQEYNGLQRRNFGRFVAREAVLDEEYWVGSMSDFTLQTAAWLRAEAHWESLSCMRHVDSYKRKYAEQEFYALKRRCMGLHGNSLKCSCFVAVKKEDKNIRRTVINSVVGTLDLSIRQFLSGETYPGEVKRPSAILASRKYAYVANVCVSKFARRQAIASNMLYLAIDAAALAGMKQLFVHVNADNKPAQELYKKTGFKIIEAASSPLLEDQRLLMSMELTWTLALTPTFEELCDE
ncbi:uncharacterized protein LOC114274144 isoform X3 [Camellia sinensis]|uniref:uncharacterized protein LOC114274144 isoform X3 n=2 Tax=Camellia sinensis TaxID=4442 RepID=UPI001035A7D0|nr:uncharacterized protein LOC114274144 isoform X3 [Camellia sinensis]